MEQNDGHYRYRLLETVRQYARERLLESGGGEAVRNRHLDYFLALAEEAEPKLTGAEQAEWLQLLDGEHDNLRAALTWSSATGGDATSGLRLAGALWWFWYARGYLGEGRGWLSGLLAAAPSRQATAARAKALNGAGRLARQQSDYPAAQVLLNESLAIQRKLGDRRGIATSLSNLGLMAWDQGDYPSARAMYEESQMIRRELGDRWGIAVSLNNLGGVAFDAGRLCSRPGTPRRESGDPAGTERPARHCLLAGQPRECGLRTGPLSGFTGVVRGELGDLSGGGRPRRASASRWAPWEMLPPPRVTMHRPARSSSRAWRFGWSWATGGALPRSLEGLSYVALALAEPGRAIRIDGAAERLREEIGSPLPPNERPRYDGHVAAARAALGDDEACDRAWQEGRALTFEQAIELALTETV